MAQVKIPAYQSGHLDVPESDLVDRTHPLGDPPARKGLTVQATGKTLQWPARFRNAMIAVCQAHGRPAELPDRVLTAAVHSQGVLLVWPSPPDELRGFPVRATVRKARTPMPEAFAALKLDLPDGIVVEAPVTRYDTPRFGPCLAIHFSHGEFLYRESKGSAIGLQDEEVEW